MKILKSFGRYQNGTVKLVKMQNIKYCYDNIINIKNLKKEEEGYEKNKSIINIINIVHDS